MSSNEDQSSSLRPDEASSSSHASGAVASSSRSSSARRKCKRRGVEDIDCRLRKDEGTSSSHTSGPAASSSRSLSGRRKRKRTGIKDNDSGIASDSENETRKKIEEYMKTLAALPDEATVHTTLFEITEEMKKDWGKVSVAVFLLHGGSSQTIQAMKRYPESRNIQTNGLYILTWILYKLRDADLLSYIFENGGVFQLAADAMTRFPEGAYLHQNAFYLLEDECGYLRIQDEDKWLKHCKTMIPFLEHTLTNKNWDDSEEDDEIGSEDLMFARLLWRISGIARGRKMLIDARLHHVIMDLSIKITDNPRKQYYKDISVRVMQDKNDETEPPF